MVSSSSVSEAMTSVVSPPSATLTVPPEMATIERPDGANTGVQGRGSGNSEVSNNNGTRVDGAGNRNDNVNGGGWSTDETCAICLTGYVGHEELRVLIPCEHAFHCR